MERLLHRVIDSLAFTVLRFHVWNLRTLISNNLSFPGYPDSNIELIYQELLSLHMA